jgi:DNA polymerase delta subunit 1
MPSLISGLKRIIEDGISIQGVGSIRGQTYESNVPFILRFMIDNKITGADWIELPPNKYSLRNPSNQTSRCSLEADIFFNNMTVHPCSGIWSSIAPLRILSYDIECQGRKGHFPDALYDPVIQIANIVSLQGCDVPIIRNVFTLNTCLPIVGSQVICSVTEEEMLMKWRAFVVACDPDVITGYNIANFDFPYLLNRAKVLFFFKKQ